MRTEKVTLGGKEYTLSELPLRQARKFREDLKTNFTELTDLFEKAPATEATNQGLADIMRIISDTLFSAVELAGEFLCMYSPAIADDWERIEEEAVSSEVVDAFIGVLTLAFPFFGSPRIATLTRMIQAAGPKNKAT